MAVKRHLNRFNAIAPLYDRLATLFFGNSIRNAQTNFLNEIPAGSNILILGGGTGWLLQELLHIVDDVHVWYVEASDVMLDMAKGKIENMPGKSSVEFVHGTQDTLPSGIEFQVVITHFYLDLFTADSLRHVISRISGQMKQNGIWLISDFVDERLWHRTYLWIMYRFFSTFCGIESTQLPNWRGAFKNSSLSKINSKRFYCGFIESAIYKVV